MRELRALVAEGTLERFASSGGAINISVRSLRALEPPDRSLATVAELPRERTPLDVIQERKVRAARAAREEEALVAAAGGGGADFRAVAPPVMSFASGRRR